MVFSSIYFLIYFLPLFLLLYTIAGAKIKNAILLLTSIFFYSWGGPKFILVILLTTILDFYLVKLMSEQKSELKKKYFLVASVCVNVGLLFYFKYCNFFIDNFNVLFAQLGMKETHWTKVLLPIGISFYTFESLTYVVDVYRKVHKPLKNFWNYQLYILLFPKLIAGPIVRYHEISDQITDRKANETANNKIYGFFRFSIGLAKKVLIANAMGEQADAIFALPVADLGATTAWIGALAYTFQIYFDFSGYSDMAIGIGRMIGFKFPENFNNPYTSGSITEFWRRWHITLGLWMKNYLYIPLGGNQTNAKWRLYFNLWIVFVLSGFWHGASWTFIIWGIYHGFFLILERSFLLKILQKSGKLTGVIYTFFVVVVGWVFFRAENIGLALGYVKKMFSFNHSIMPFITNNDFDVLVYVAAFFAFFTLTGIGQKVHDHVFYSTFKIKGYVLLAACSLILFFFSLTSVAASGFNPFIYFRF